MTRGQKGIVYFDGVCGLCNRFVDFLLKRKNVSHFQFAPLQGQTASEQLPGSIHELFRD